MRSPRVLSIVFVLSACGDSSDSSSGFASNPTDVNDSTGTGGTATPTTTPTSSEPMTTAMVSDSASDTDSDSGPTPTTGDSASATTGASAETTDTDDVSTGAADSTGAASVGSTGDDSSTGGTTGPGCPEGQDGCPCGPGNSCDPGLECAQGLCGPPAPKCGDGKVDPGEACDDGNQSNGDGCEANCTKTPVMPPAKDACGYDEDGVWFQIDYSNAFSVSNPTYTYSATPGWGEAQWAPTGKDWPYAVDLFNNAKVVMDQIGKVALLDGTNKAVRVYFGLGGLTYDYATVCVEGRSYSVGSSVTFFVMEAKSKNGDYGMMANDWTVHATGVDMQHWFLEGDEFQAVQVQPSSGSGALSLTRMRVTLHGANY